MPNKALDANLASILASIRETLGPDDRTAEAMPSVTEGAASPADDSAAAESDPALPPASGRTVEEFLADLIRPKLDAWLAAHLPEIVQKMAAAEIAKLTGRG